MRLLGFIIVSWMVFWNSAYANSVSINPIVLTEQTPQKITETLEWCETDEPIPQNNLPSLIGLCDFQPVPAKSLLRGFTSKTQLLKFQLHNPTDEPLMRWLEVGNPRMANINLFHLDENGWRQQTTGQDVPSHARPIVSQRLLMPIELEPHQVQTYYLSVNTETKLDLSLTLWSLKDYLSEQSQRQIIQSLGIGGLMLAAFFTLMIYLKMRQGALLWLFASFVCQILLDASYTGMLKAYFWPVNLPYHNGLHGIFIGTTILFLVLFLRGFLKTSERYPAEDRVLKILLFLLVLTSVAFVWEYALPVRIIAVLVLLTMLVSVWVFFRAWRDGFGPAGYLLISYFLLLFLIIYRAASAFGWVHVIPLQTLGFSWYFLLIAPTTLLAVLKHAENLQENLIRTQAEKEAHKRFLANMGHELRSPLNAILGQSRQLQLSPLKQVKQTAKLIESTGYRLLSMIEEILDYSRTQAGTLKIYPEPTDLNEFFTELERDLNSLEPNHNNQIRHKVAPNLPDQVQVDGRRLRQVLDNLISNANRYCQNGVIEIQVNAISTNENQVKIEISVTDTGQGMSPEEQKMILEPFQRGSTAERQVPEGMGLGLSITSEILQLMNSELRIQSELNKGSCFSFQLELPVIVQTKSAIESIEPACTPTQSHPEPQQLQKLIEMVEHGAITDIQVWLQTMQKQAPQHQAFYAQIQQALKKLDFNRIQCLAREKKGETE